MRIPPELEQRAERVPVEFDLASVAVESGAMRLLVSAGADAQGMAWLAELHGLTGGRQQARVLPLPREENEFVAGRLRALVAGEANALGPEHLEHQGELAPAWEREAAPGEVLLAWTPADAAREFEARRGSNERRRRGAFYTQAAEIELITRLALTQLLAERDPAGAAAARAFVLGDREHPPVAALEALAGLLEEITVLDPACGAGAFLVGGIATLADVAARVGRALGRSVDIHALRRDLASRATGVDCDAEALAHARRRLTALCGDAPRLVHADALLGSLDPALLVIGNPPYVRQERIASPDGGAPGTPSYKQKLLDSARAAGHPISKRADLCVPFIHRGLDLLSPGGVLAYVVSASWLDLDFARELRQRLVSAQLLRSVHESQTARSFRDADVNTVLLLAGSRADAGACVRFTSWRRALADAPAPAELARALCGESVATGSGIRVRSAAWSSLDPRASWGGVWLRAPDVHARVLESARMTQLGQLAKVRFGNKSGANSFFYLDEAARREAGLPDEVLVPILMSARECPGYLTSSATVRRAALFIADERAIERDDAVARYLELGVERGVDRASSVAARRPWWRQETRAPAALLLPRRIGERFVVFANDAGLLEDNNLFGIDPRPGVDVEVLGALLNSSWIRLAIELASRPLTGSQPLIDTNVYIIRQLPVVDPQGACADSLAALCDAWRRLRQRRVLGLEDELDDPSRRGLDVATLALLGVDQKSVESVRTEIAFELAAMVRRRLHKSQNVRSSDVRRGAAPG